MNSKFSYILKTGTLENAKKFYDENKDEIDLNYNKGLFIKCCCYEGKLDLVAWLILELNINTDLYGLFFLSCINSKFYVAQWLYEYSKHTTIIDFHKNDDELLSHICNSGNMDSFGWLWNFSLCENSRFTLNTGKNKPFINACKNEHIYLADLLFEYNKIHGDIINVRDNDDEIFRYCCDNKKLKTLKWMIKTFEFYSGVIINNELMWHKIRKIEDIIL